MSHPDKPTDGDSPPTVRDLESLPTFDPAEGSEVDLTAAPAAPAAPPIVPGYETLGELGRGGMGVVYKARQTGFNRVVALKVLAGGAHAAADERARFRAEALSAGQVQHPNVVQVYDVGEHEGVAYLAMEFVGGGSLTDRLKGNPMPVPAAVGFMLAVARGVGAAHARGVVHRDLKPGNILLTEDGVPKVADFGLAKQLGAETLTMSGTIMGTPGYMAPEQAAGQTRRIGPQADVYSLGAILYECLTGVPPFKGDSVLDTLDKVRFTEAVPVRIRRPEVPVVLEVICRRCLDKVPAERYSTADALADDLERVKRALEARPLAAVARPADRGKLWVGLACFVVAAIGFLIATQFNLDDRTTPTNPTNTGPDIPPGNLRETP